jgi:hypothetical protein
MGFKEIEELWETEGVDYFTHRLDALAHIVEADLSKPFITTRVERTFYRNEEISRRIVLVKEGRLEPEILTKLKRKAEYSLRQDFANIGKVQLADVFIAPGKHLKT